ncbi:MAG: hypothetical protein IIB57_11320 [Planctomycetes bacterium]|nr:hypothetical protein [Planctomycetota bacterium]
MIDCNQDGLPDDCAPDCNHNDIPDECDIAAGTSLDDDGNGIPDECDAHTPLPAIAPHDRKKNRYLSFGPNNADIAVALQVTLTASLNHPGALGTFMWVGEPDADGIARLIGTPVTRLWPESVIHATGCFISPVAEYEVRASIDEGATRSDPLLIDTIDQPSDGNFWGDTVGAFNGAEWSPSQGVPNIDDAVAVIKTWQQADGSPPSTVTDVEPQFINKVVNINDVFFVILAFQGDPYPFGCPDDPCQDTSVIPCP